MDALLLHRIHFAFTIMYHYLFPQLTMGLALLIVVLKTIAIRCKEERYNEAVRFWARIFAINFLIVVDWHSDGISVWHELVAILAYDGRCHRSAFGDGRSLLVFSGITRRKETRKAQPTSNAAKLLLLLQRTSLLMRSLLVGFTLIVMAITAPMMTAQKDEGIWAGPDSKIPNTRGIRNDVVGALRAIKVPNVRWPDGCFADESRGMMRPHQCDRARTRPS